jgi:hypothetical protein
MQTLIVSTYALRKYFHDVPTKKGSLLMASIAQNPIGIRTQFRPAAGIVSTVTLFARQSQAEPTSYVGEIFFDLDDLPIYEVHGAGQL